MVLYKQENNIFKLKTPEAVSVVVFSHCTVAATLCGRGQGAINLAELF